MKYFARQLLRGKRSEEMRTKKVFVGQVSKEIARSYRSRERPSLCFYKIFPIWGKRDGTPGKIR